MQMNKDESLSNHMTKIDKNFRVTTVIFKHFTPIFDDIFKNRTLSNSSKIDCPKGNKR